MTKLTPEQWRRVNAVFDLAVERPPAEWAEIVRTGGAGDPAVQAEVLALLSSHETAPSFLAAPVAQLSPRTLMSRLDKAFKPVQSFAPGDVLGDFEIQSLLGEGGFARVYAARQRSLGRLVALKVTPNVGKEARTMAGLEHDHIVHVYSETVDATLDMRVICMQLVPGTTLQHLIDELGKLLPETRDGTAILDIIDAADTTATTFNAAAVKDREALARSDHFSACLWIGARLAEALAFAHGRGILHLDVKPANILLNRYGRPMLTDFNVSLGQGDIEAKNPEVLGGTISYMSPEHLEVFTTKDTSRLDTIDHRSDIYSLGMVLTELLTCQRAQTIEDVETGSMLLGNTDELPEEIASVLHRAVKIDPKDRFQSGGAFADALENCREVAAIRREIPLGSRWIRLAHKHPVATVTVLALLPQLLGSAVNITYNSIRVVEKLTPLQQETFADLILPYNAIVYPIGAWIVWRQVAFLLRSLRERRDRTMPNPETMAELRRKVLIAPYALLLATSIGWLPGAWLFPAVIDALEGPIAKGVYAHFATSFISSWLIALTYSFLLVESVVLQVIYPRFWTGCCNIRESSRFELRKVGRRLRVFQVLAGLIPLAGAMMIVGAGPEMLDPERYQVFQVMVVGLISLGMSGFVFAMKTSEDIKRTVTAFTMGPQRR